VPVGNLSRFRTGKLLRSLVETARKHRPGEALRRRAGGCRWRQRRLPDGDRGIASKLRPGASQAGGGACRGRVGINLSEWV